MNLAYIVIMHRQGKPARTILSSLTVGWMYGAVFVNTGKFGSLPAVIVAIG